MPVTFQLDLRSRMHTRPARSSVSSDDKAYYAKYDAVYATECHSRDPPEANLGREANRQSQRLGQGSVPVLEEGGQRNVHAKVNESSEV